MGLPRCSECDTPHARDQEFCENCGTRLIEDIDHNTTVSATTTEKKTITNFKPYLRLIQGSLLLTWLPVISIIISLFFMFNESMGDALSQLISYMSQILFAYGLYRVSRMTKIKRNKIILASIYIGIYLFTSIILSLTMSIWVKIPVEVSTITGLYQLTSLFIISFILELIGLYGFYLFTQWYKTFSEKYQLEFTKRFQWMMIIRVISNGLFILSGFYLLSYVNNGDSHASRTALTLLGLGSWLLIGAVILQVLAGAKLYNNLKEIQKRQTKHLFE